MANKTTLEQAVLIDRVSKGDISAIGDLWENVFGSPVDPKRPLQEILDEVAAEIAPPKTDEEIAKEKAQAAVNEAFEAGQAIMDAVIRLTTKTKGKS